MQNLAASAAQAHCKYLMYKSACILSDWGRGGEVCISIGLHVTLFFPQNFVQCGFAQYTVITPPNNNSERGITVYDIL